MTKQDQAKQASIDGNIMEILRYLYLEDPKYEAEYPEIDIAKSQLLELILSCMPEKKLDNPLSWEDEQPSGGDDARKFGETVGFNQAIDEATKNVKEKFQ